MFVLADMIDPHRKINYSGLGHHIVRQISRKVVDSGNEVRFRGGGTEWMCSGSGLCEQGGQRVLVGRSTLAPDGRNIGSSGGGIFGGFFIPAGWWGWAKVV